MVVGITTLHIKANYL